MIIKINYAKRFLRAFKKLTPNKQQLAIEREKIFIKDPFSLTLKTHKLSGELKEYWSFSITYQDRVMFRFVNDHEVIFYRIGSHDIYK
ncbi:MAG: type II toxin-antitoxin system mRNA interferase toxin, RelE/StbE family [Candidatus Daviesbacteria bacterium]|nr:type II toxin-antitoxin system mRNA interferase toxin, RelE/StbE family [Candidatus Daviesbacteria bacterium]